jgi:hypothetical protein
MRLVFGQNKMWPGWLWWAVDIVLFWTLIAIAQMFFSMSRAKKQSPATPKLEESRAGKPPPET